VTPLEFPSVVDSTMLSDWRACHQRFMRAHLQDWKPSGTSIHLHAGASYAAGLEAARRAFFVDGRSESESESAGLRALLAHYGDFDSGGHAKSADRMAEALVFYFDKYPLASDPKVPHIFPDGKRGIEFSFATPLPYAHPVTGLPLIYSGRADMVCDYLEGVWILDDKTASSLGNQWLAQWKMRSQFTSYCWAAREAGFSVAGVIVRGVSILKTKYDTLESLEPRPNWVIDRWLTQVIHDLTDMERCWNAGYWDWNLDHACADYGGCDFVDVCTSQDAEAWLRVGFERRHWNPLTRTETLIPETQ
jgi:hypothetical protein